MSLLAIEKNRSVTSIYYSQYKLSDGEDTLSGSRIGLSYRRELTEIWSYFVRVNSGSASGTHEADDGSETELKASTIGLSGGMRVQYDVDVNSNGESDLIPYLGVGLTVQSYNYDFSYQDSEVGETSGTGYGPVVTLGMTIIVSDGFSLIPGYYYESVTIKTEGGDSKTISSSGVSFAFVARF